MSIFVGTWFFCTKNVDLMNLWRKFWLLNNSFADFDRNNVISQVYDVRKSAQ